MVNEELKKKLSQIICDYIKEQPTLWGPDDLAENILEQFKDKSESLERRIKYCTASINGALNGLELDNTCDVIEKSIVIEQMKIELNLLNPK